MGMKKRDFTGKMKAAIIAALTTHGPMTRRQILETLRAKKSLTPSVRRVGLALSRLIKRSQVEQVGSRKTARFRVCAG